MSRKVGVIDIGSNTIKLLIYGEAGALLQDTRPVRLGEGISQDPPKMSPEAISRGVATVHDLHSIAKAQSCETVLVVATSAVRDAENGNDFCEQVEEKTHTKVHILSGENEAYYIAKGALTDSELEGSGSFNLFDLGGGSLECVHFTEGKVGFAESLQIGAVRLTEQFVADRAAAVSPETLQEIRDYTLGALPEAFPVKGERLVGMGGGLSVVCKIFGGGRVIRHVALEKFTRMVSSMDLQKRLSNPNIPAIRGDILPAALTVILAIMEKAEVEDLLFSPYNLKYGLGDSLLRDQGAVFEKIGR